jgi:hypothetical protein
MTPEMNMEKAWATLVKAAKCAPLKAVRKWNIYQIDVDAALSGSSPCPHAAEVERLKAELKTANENLTTAHMVGYHKRDEEVRGLEEALSLADKMAEAIRHELSECTCSVEYKSRGMADPSCAYCDQEELRLAYNAYLAARRK